jgi:hypothetical protein
MSEIEIPKQTPTPKPKPLGKKRGRKPKNKNNNTTEPKVLKKRGRKPKPKPLVMETVVKKKRGRKKKCEMNLETYKKISGFNENEDSIDTKDNKIQIGHTNVNESDSNLPCENIKFAGLMIKKHNIPKYETNDLQKILHEQTKKEKKCDIDISDMNIDDEDDNNNNSEKKNLYDFFGDLESNLSKKRNVSNNHLKLLQEESTKIKKKKKENKNNDIKILQCYNGIKSYAPKETNIWCWWCCHPFDTIPRFAPTKYDELRDRYQVTGNFCSWGCVKSYMLHDNTLKVSSSMCLLTMMIRSINGSLYNVVTCAPPRQALKVFGGNMSIHDFRNIDKNEYFEVNTNKMTLDDSIFIKRRKY